ncbi:MAG: hypothetical protein OXC60_05890 [Litoreibacter sp.]|nr:hypothetical protein [Litoreibacter sp.]MCY4334188.1 hypothetical protein [Litoreibacter sp.]
MVTSLQIIFPVIELHAVLQGVGVLGFVTYMGAFAALQMGRLDGNGVAYALLNVVAAGLVLVSLLSAFNLASMLIQISWIVIGGVGIWRHLARARDRSAPAIFLRRR